MNRHLFVVLVCSLLIIVGSLQGQSGSSAADAAALLAEEKWEAAAAAFTALADGDPKDGSAWFGLAQARHGAGDLKAALAAYDKAQEAGFAAGRVLFHRARALAAQGQAAAAVRQLEALADAGAKIAGAVSADADLAKLAGRDDYARALARLTPCSDPPYRQFDFWLGEWDVINQGTGAKGAINRITAVHGGCSLHEDYENGAFEGSSLNAYDQGSGKWYQTWMDNQGTVLRLSGGMVGGSMQLSSASDSSPVNRITWTPNDDGSVRQHWETSTDGGKTWNTAFDGLYVKRSQP
ncbi:MAG: tetratricopeptide repeat protein [Acidobacteriota bacterium]